MRSTSDSIAQLAAALAKAQIELVNPAKTLTGVIDRWGTGNEGQSYRYAPLSAGLDIVRGTLCKHELAVIQTTHVDHDSSMVLLTTTLAHGSGEWICATWPVCRTADMVSPKLMGAALTYARRYGLFTLVGIAGEDDLDAPAFSNLRGDLASRSSTAFANGSDAVHSKQANAYAAEHAGSMDSKRHAGDRNAPEQSAPAPRRRRRDAGVPRPPRIPREMTFMARDLAAVPDAEALLKWALDVLPVRNALDENSRAALDRAFLERAKALEVDPELLVAFTGAAGTDEAAISL